MLVVLIFVNYMMYHVCKLSQSHMLDLDYTSGVFRFIYEYCINLELDVYSYVCVFNLSCVL